MSYRDDFLEFAIQQQALSFGRFTLKSGRVSPYFFNAGKFQTGAALGQLGRFYAQAIIESQLQFDMLFGPAYKGIPLVSAIAIALAEHHQQDYPYAFNRKEAKDHGEGGVIVGAPLQGRVLIVDDVMTAGTAIREAMQLVTAQQAQLAGVALSLDRQERGQGQTSAVQEVRQKYQVPVISIAGLDDIIHYASQNAQQSGQLIDLAAIEQYRSDYGVDG